MRHTYGLLALFVCALANAAPGAAAVELLVPSFDETVPPCRVRVHVKTETCQGNRCLIPAHQGKSAAPIELHLTCLPSYSPTGFENAAPEVEVRSIRTRTTKGAVSLIDNDTLPSIGPHQDVNFCLYGEQTNFCGYAKVAKVRGKRSPAIDRIISLIQRIEWAPASKKQ